MVPSAASTSLAQAKNEIEQLQALLNSCSSAVLQLSFERNIVYANKAAAILYECSIDDLTNMKLSDLVCNTDINKLNMYFDKVCDGSQNTQNEKSQVYICPQKNKSTLYVSVNLDTFHHGIVATITKSLYTEHIQQKLDDTIQRFKVAQAASQVGVWEYNTQTQELIWDEQMFVLYQCEPETFTATRSVWNESLHPADFDDTVSALAQSVSLGVKLDISFRIITPKNQVRTLKAYGHPIKDKHDNVIKVIGVNYDVTDFKTLENELKEQREILEATGVMAKLGGWKLDLASNQAIWSDVVYHIHELPVGSQVNLVDALSYYESDSRPKIEEAVKRAIEENIPWDFQSKFITATGKRIWVRTTGYAEFTDGVATTLRGAFQDITELKKAEQKAQEASLAKSAFLANMSHEIRTPINGILGMNDLLLSSNINSKQRYFAELIKISSQSLLHLINDILDFSKIEAGKLDINYQHTNVHSLLGDIADAMSIRAQEKNLELILDIDPCVPVWATIDPNRLRQVLINLLGNAVKFTDKGEVILSARTCAGKLEFTVCDTGSGIPKEKQSVLFSKFMQVDNSSTRKHGGTGLGLAISHQLVEMMGGEIILLSDVDSGSTFSFTISQTQTVSSYIEKNESEQQVLAAKRLLVVDPNTSVHKAINNFLTKTGIVIEQAENAPMAMQKLKQAHAQQQSFDFVLIESTLLGMSGMELSKAICNSNYRGEASIIMMTSEMMDASQLQHSACVNNVVIKPLKAANLVSVLLNNEPQTEEIDEKRPSQGKRKSAARKSTGKILVVEDNYINQQVMGSMLEQLGYDFAIAENGQIALETLANNPQSFNLVLMDCQMPTMDGFDATKNVRATKQAQYTKIPIVAVTANAMSGDKAKCLAAGMNDYLEKPVLLSQLTNMIQKWMH